MQRDELFDLTWFNVNLKDKLLTIEGAKAKSGSTRHIPLKGEALGALIAWRNQAAGDHLVFPNPNTGKQFGNIKKSWAGLMKLAEITNFRFHDLRAAPFRQ